MMNSYLHVLNGLCEKVQKSMANKTGDDIEWNVDVEILLFVAMIGHKPVGMNRYFMMASIHEKFSNFINRQITSKPIWNHLDTMYDMAALHESEIIPFPNEEVEFELPAEDFDEIAIHRLGVAPTHAQPNATVKTPNSKVVQKPKQTPSSSSKKASDFLFRKPLPQTTPVSVKLNKNSLSDTKSNEKGMTSTAKTDKGKITKNSELLMHAEVKVEAATQSQLKKALKLDKLSDDKERKVREGVNNTKATKSSSSIEASNNKHNSQRSEDKVHTKMESTKRDTPEFKVPSNPQPKSWKKEATGYHSSSSGKALKELDGNKRKRSKSMDSRKSEPSSKRRRT